MIDRSKHVDYCRSTDYQSAQQNTEKDMFLPYSRADGNMSSRVVATPGIIYREVLPSVSPLLQQIFMSSSSLYSTIHVLTETATYMSSSLPPLHIGHSIGPSWQISY